MALGNSNVPFDVILNALDVPRDTSRTPLFQALFNYRPRIEDSRSFLGCNADGMLVSGGENAYDVSVDITDSNTGEVIVVLSVNSGLYTVGDATLLQNTYVKFLQEFVQDPTLKIARPPFMDEDIQKAIIQGRGFECEAKWPPTIVHRIEDIVQRYGNRIALKEGSGECLTYEEMETQVKRISGELLRRGVSHGSTVGVFQQPGIAWVCSLLAVLRVGAICVPLDQDVGEYRLALIAKDCRPIVLLVGNSTEEHKFIRKTDCLVINTSRLADTASEDALQEPICPGQIAVISYTSGSTGIPNGVLIKHESLRNFLEFSPPRWHFKEGKETVLQQSSYAFDMSIGQVLLCLTYGGTLIIPDRSQRKDPQVICKMIFAEDITFTLGTLTEYLGWLRSGNNHLLRGSKWRGAMSGGEIMTASLCEAFRSLEKRDLLLVNSYGPAETTFGCADTSIPYERGLDGLGLIPVDNCAFHIVDEQLQPVPRGVPGQIMIGGAGVSPGYLNRTEMTSKRFIKHVPVSSFMSHHHWESAFLSGDRGVLNNEGRLIILGRIEGSTQIKLGGIRIDLEDIESTITQSMAPYVAQAIVSPRENEQTGTPYLVAFLVLADGKLSMDRESLVAAVTHQLPLPPYMRPSISVIIKKFPMTSSNKVDRQAISLMSPDDYRSSDPIRTIPMLDDAANSMRKLWEDVLPQSSHNHRSITGKSDFFHMGGNSLGIVNLQHLFRNKFGIQVSLNRLFEAATLDQMAEVFREKNGPGADSNAIDWETEADIPSHLTDNGNTNTCRSTVAKNRLITVVLTGATGFLGKELLSHLVNNENIVKVHCIAVRKPQSKLSQLFTHAKVVIHAGDLGAKQLGLTDKAVKDIFDEADVMIHAGADVSFMKTYRSLKLTNVASTMELVGLCLPRKIPFHFVSSATVASLSGQKIFGASSVREFAHNVNERQGYIASKWTNEVFLENISTRFGLPVVVHRPSSITGAGAPETDLMGNIVHFVHATAKLPDTSSWSGYLDFVALQSVAHSIVGSIFEGMDHKKGHIDYIYQSGDVIIGLEEMQSRVNGGNGELYKVVPLREWIESATASGMNPLLGTYLQHAAEANMTLPRLVTA